MRIEISAMKILGNVAARADAHQVDDQERPEANCQLFPVGAQVCQVPMC